MLNNPKVHVRIGDAREVLLTTSQTYDLIASEPSNPFRAGIASLFTQEYYRAASDRLTDDGLFLQWLQAYGVDASAVRTVYATMASVFPSVETWQTRGGDIVLVGAKRAPVYDAARASPPGSRKNPTKRRCAWRGGRAACSGFLGRYLAGDRLARAIGSAPGVQINTDDRNVVEFGFARSLGRDYQMVSQIRALAQAVGATRPPIDAAAIDWAAVDMSWVSQIAAEGGVIQISPQANPADRARQLALIHYYREDNPAAARAMWAQQSSIPADQNEVAMVADLQATAGAPEAMATIDRLRQYHSGEADVILAEALFAQRDYERLGGGARACVRHLPARSLGAAAIHPERRQSCPGAGRLESGHRPADDRSAQGAVCGEGRRSPAPGGDRFPDQHRRLQGAVR